MNHLLKTGKAVIGFYPRHSAHIEKIAITLLCAGLCIFHYHVREYRADTLVFQGYLEQYDFWEFLTWRIQTWSGRFILEGLLYIILELPYLIFAILDSIIILGGVFALRTLLEWKNFQTTVFIFLLLFFPAAGLIEVGIQPGAINYIWAFVAAIIALIPLEMIYRDKCFHWYHYVLFSIAALIGCNMEQTAAIVFSFYLLAVIYFFVLKKLKPIALSQMFLSAVSLVFHMTCKGNAARLVQETANYWVGFEKLSPFEKLWNGWFTTVNYFYTERDIPFLLFLAVLCVWVWMKYRKMNVYTIFGTLPFLIRLGIWMGKFPDAVFGTDIRYMAKGVRYEDDIMKAPPIPIYPQVILYTTLFFMIFVAILGCFQSIEETLLILLILAAGIICRLLMGFSPTLIASGIRTFFFTDAALCIAVTWFAEKISSLLKHRCSMEKRLVH